MKRIGTILMALVVLSAMVGNVDAVTDGVTTKVITLAGILDHITVTPTGITVYPGTSQDFNAIGYEAGEQEKQITETWTQTGGVTTGTGIGDTTGLLTVAKAEQQHTITVRATDTSTTIFGEATVSVGELKSININENSIVFSQNGAGVKRGETSDTNPLTIYNDGNVDTGVSITITPLKSAGLLDISGDAVHTDVTFPKNILYGANQPVSLTLTVPATAELGTYEGTITFETISPTV